MRRLPTARRHLRRRGWPAIGAIVWLFWRSDDERRLRRAHTCPSAVRRGRAGHAIHLAGEHAAALQLLAEQLQPPKHAAIDQCITHTRDGPAQNGRIHPLIQQDPLPGKPLQIGYHARSRHLVNRHRGGEIRVYLVMVVVVLPCELVTNSRRKLHQPALDQQQREGKRLRLYLPLEQILDYQLLFGELDVWLAQEEDQPVIAEIFGDQLEVLEPAVNRVLLDP